MTHEDPAPAGAARAHGFGGAEAVGRLGSLSATLGAGSVVQLLGAVAGFVTIPLQVHALGGSAFGVLVVVSALAPWLTLVDGALYPATRLLVGESRTSSDVVVAPQGLLRSSFRLALRIAAANLCTLVLALVVLPLVALFGAGGVTDRGELVRAVLCFSLPIVLSGPGGVYLGALEGVGRTVAAAVISGLGPLVALPLTALVVLGGGDLVALCAAQGVSVALPRLLAWAYWSRKPSHSEERTLVALRMTLVAQLMLLSVGNVIQTGLDPVIVSSRLGAEPAGAFGLANRLVLGALIPIAVLSPLFAASLAAARGQGWTTERDVGLRRLVLQATAAGLFVGACVCGIGPVLAEILGGGEVAAPLSLYAAGGAFVLVTFMNTPLYLAFSGPRGLAASVRLNIVLVVLNVCLSLWLVDVVGPSGPLWGSAVSGAGAVLFWLMAWRHRPEWLGEIHGPEPVTGQASS